MNSFSFFDRTECRQSLGIPDDEYVIGTVGRLVSVKNQSFIIDFFSKAFKEDLKAKLLIVGGGELEDSLRLRCRELGIESQCVFTGAVDAPAPFFMAMDVFLLPSLFEGFPRAVMEAVASGLRCYLSNTITDEIEKCGNVKRLPLDIDIWAKELTEYRNIYHEADRTKGVETIKGNGLDISVEIKRIEKEYCKIINDEL